MNSHISLITRRHEQMLNYMSILQSDLRECHDFASLQSEASVDRLSGQPWGPSSVCDSRWTLRGYHGTLEIRAFVDYAQGAKLRMTITCSDYETSSGVIERQFGGENQPPCTLVGIMPVITELLHVVTKGRQDPFTDVVVPKVL